MMGDYMRVINKSKINMFIFTIIIMTILLCFSSQAKAEQEGNYTYQIINMDEAQITQYTGPGGAVTIPSSLGGVPVVSIGGNSFFGCVNVTSIYMPEGITHIGPNAFYSCSGLININIPQGLSVIHHDAFASCVSLNSISIPDSVIIIGDQAFTNCSSLVSINVDENNAYFASLDGVLFNKEMTVLIQCPTGISVNSLTIPQGVVDIAPYAFKGCKSLTTISIPQSVTNIGEAAFTECTGLTSITIPQGVTGIASSTFAECTGLTNVTLPQEVNSIGKSAFSWCTGLTSVTLPNEVESLGDAAFNGCTGLTSISIPVGLTTIGRSAFEYCLGLTSITIPQSVTSLGPRVFAECAGLTSIIISPNVVIIEHEAFKGCSSLTDFTIPQGVTRIGYGAFADCTGLTSINIPQNVISIEQEAFKGCSGLTSITIPQSVTNIGQSIFAYCTGLTSIPIPQGFSYIPAGAFEGCTGLKNAIVPQGILFIDSSAFSFCSSLTSITIPEGVTDIRSWAFAHCRGLININIPDSVTSIGRYAFYDCTGLISTTFSSATTTIYDHENTIPTRTKIIGYDPSTAKDYATKYGRTFEVIACKAITSFVFTGLDPQVTGDINESAKTIALIVPQSTDVTALAPDIEYIGSSISPSSGVAQNFTDPVTYTVTASDDSTVVYTVRVTIIPDYTITITEAPNGSTSGAGSYEEGSAVTLGAVSDPGYNFDGWYEGETKVSSLPGYTFTATRDMTLTPVFVPMQKGYLEVTTVGGGNVTLNGDSIPLSANYKLLHFRGTPVTLTAAADSNYTFAYWEDVNSASIVSAEPVYESVMGSGINVKAVFIPAPTEASTYFNVIFKDKSGKILQSTNIAKNASAVPPVSPTIAGYDFTGWDVDYTNVTGNIITGALYTRAATKYTVTVTGGTLSTGGTSGEYQFDWPVTLVADSAPAGQKFSHWEKDNVKVSTKSTFSFFMPQHATTLAAVFVDEEVVLDNSPFITLSPDVIVDYSNKIIMFTAIRNIPAEYTLVESGVLLLESDTPLSEELTVDTASVIRGKISNASTDQFYIRKTNVTDGDTWYGRAYMIFEDANGNLITVYSENTENATMNS